MKIKQVILYFFMFATILVCVFFCNTNYTKKEKQIPNIIFTRKSNQQYSSYSNIIKNYPSNYIEYDNLRSNKYIVSKQSIGHRKNFNHIYNYSPICSYVNRTQKNTYTVNYISQNNYTNKRSINNSFYNITTTTALNNIPIIKPSNTNNSNNKEFEPFVETGTFYGELPNFPNDPGAVPIGNNILPFIITAFIWYLIKLLIN